eukprot:6854835-Karenia_brevis.AAC.1
MQRAIDHHAAKIDQLRASVASMEKRIDSVNKQLEIDASKPSQTNSSSYNRPADPGPQLQSLCVMPWKNSPTSH